MEKKRQVKLKINEEGKNKGKRRQVKLKMNEEGKNKGEKRGKWN